MPEKNNFDISTLEKIKPRTENPLQTGTNNPTTVEVTERVITTTLTTTQETTLTTLQEGKTTILTTASSTTVTQPTTVLTTTTTIVTTTTVIATTNQQRTQKIASPDNIDQSAGCPALFRPTDNIWNQPIKPKDRIEKPNDFAYVNFRPCYLDRKYN